MRSFLEPKVRDPTGVHLHLVLQKTARRLLNLNELVKEEGKGRKINMKGNLKGDANSAFPSTGEPARRATIATMNIKWMVKGNPFL